MYIQPTNDPMYLPPSPGFDDPRGAAPGATLDPQLDLADGMPQFGSAGDLLDPGAGGDVFGLDGNNMVLQKNPYSGELEDLAALYAYLMEAIDKYLGQLPTSGAPPDLNFSAVPDTGGGTPDPSGEPPVPQPTGRPPGDNRSADEIIGGSKVARDLGHQKDINREGLKKWTGDWEDPDPERAADAAYNLVQVLEYIDTMKSADGQHRGKEAGDGNIAGLTADGDARAGTEAAAVKDFSERGYASLEEQGHYLRPTNDTHVRWDGSNKDNFQWFLGEVGDKLSFVPVIGDTLVSMGDARDAGGVFMAGLEGVMGVVGGGPLGLLKSFTGGQLDPIAMLQDIYNGSY